MVPRCIFTMACLYLALAYVAAHVQDCTDSTKLLSGPDGVALTCAQLGELGGCAHPKYRSTLIKHCPKTCKACEPEETTQTPQTPDAEPAEFCAEHLRDGNDAKYTCMDLSNMGVCDAKQPTEGNDVKEYAYSTLTWYKELRAQPVKKTLSMDDFKDGTFRITEPGRYQLTEDIVFAPNAHLTDSTARFWPQIHSSKYPMGQFYLGFFAAITVETKDVWIDLNGFEIKQRFDFYVRQRWFSNIELSDRAFVSNEGVSSLKFQEGDKMFFTPDGKEAGNLDNELAGHRHRFGANGAGKSAARVIISGGALGLSSHAGIHGNNNIHIVVEDVVVKDFDVAGVQFNGGDYVAVVDTVVGPSHQKDVPSHRLSHAVFLNLYAHRFLPGGLFHLRQKYPNVPYDAVLRQLTGMIKFADRPGQKFGVQWVFDRLYYAQELFIEHMLPDEFKQYNVGSERESADYGLTLEDAIELFANPTGLPDGSALYGIVFHRLGAAVGPLAGQDEAFHGPEHRSILIKNVKVHGLKHHTVQVPSLAFADGTFIQGPVRDVVDVANIISGRLQSPRSTYYKGNVLSDSYLAFWQLSNDFYSGHVLSSECGNFGSNLVSKFADCNGKVVNTKLTGRDIVMLQKKYFGGIKMSQGFFDWATTPGAAFADLIDRSPDVKERRQERHYVTCGHDAMFHSNKGAIGLRLEFVEDVVVQNTTITDVSNTADVGHWLCGEKWRLPDTGELIEPKQLSLAGDLGGDVRGVTLAKIDGIKFKDVHIDGLVSLEGQAFGIALTGDANDRRDYVARFGRQVTLLDVSIGKILAGAGRAAKPLSSDLSTMAAGAHVSTDATATAHNHLDAPRVSMRHVVSNKTVSLSKGNYVEMSFMPAFMLNRDRVLAAFGYTDSQMNALALEAISYLESEFGVDRKLWRQVNESKSMGAMAHPMDGGEEDGTMGPIDFMDDAAWVWHQRLVLVNKHSAVFFGVQRHPGQDFHTETMCAGTNCAGPLQQSPAHNFVFLLMLLDKTPAGAYKAHGLWGGPEGKLVYPSQILIMGTYIVENPPLEQLGLGKGKATRSEDVMVKFYGTCPIDFAGTRTRINKASSACNKIKHSDIFWNDKQCIELEDDNGNHLGCKVETTIAPYCCSIGFQCLAAPTARNDDDCRNPQLEFFSGTRGFLYPQSKSCVSDDWVETSIINCKLDGGPLLGKGWGVGTYSLTKSNGMYTVEITDEQIFDDHAQPHARGIGTGVTNNRCGGGSTMVGHPYVVQVRVDGVIPVGAPFHGRELLPHTKQYHQFHEAGTKFFRQWASLSTEEMYALRAKAYEYFRDEIMLGTPTTAEIPNPNIAGVLADPQGHYIENDIALGGGNSIFPYATNDVLNQRAYTMAGTQMPAVYLNNSGIKEGGFIMIAGRAGIHSKEHGFLPYGTTIKYGIYVINDLGSFGTVRVHFKDSQPMIPDLIDHGSINQQLWSHDKHAPGLASGIAQGLVSSFDIGGPNFNNRGANPARGMGVQYNTRFSMMFGENHNPLGEEADLGVMCDDGVETGAYYVPKVTATMSPDGTGEAGTGGE